MILNWQLFIALSLFYSMPLQSMIPSDHSGDFNAVDQKLKTLEDHFTQQPQDIKKHIISFVPIKDILSLQATNKDNYDFIIPLRLEWLGKKFHTFFIKEKYEKGIELLEIRKNFLIKKAPIHYLPSCEHNKNVSELINILYVKRDGTLNNTGKLLNEKLHGNSLGQPIIKNLPREDNTLVAAANFSHQDPWSDIGILGRYNSNFGGNIEKIAKLMIREGIESKKEISYQKQEAVKSALAVNQKYLQWGLQEYLYSALGHKNDSMVDLLIQYGADINAPINLKNSETFIHKIVKQYQDNTFYNNILCIIFNSCQCPDLQATVTINRNNLSLYQKNIKGDPNNIEKHVDTFLQKAYKEKNPEEIHLAVQEAGILPEKVLGLIINNFKSTAFETNLLRRFIESYGFDLTTRLKNFGNKSVEELINELRAGEYKGRVEHLLKIFREVNK